MSARRPTHTHTRIPGPEEPEGPGVPVSPALPPSPTTVCFPPPSPNTTRATRQEFLESTFPGYHAAPTQGAIASAAAGDDGALEKREREGRLTEPRLNVGNTLAKFVLDQTFGAVANTLLYGLFIHSIQMAMGGPPPAQSLKYLLSGHAVDYDKVDWDAVVRQTSAEFWDIMSAGWKLWPAVSLINFAFIRTVQGRSLLTNLAGVGWGVYMSLFAAR